MLFRSQLSRTRPNRLTFGSDGIGSGNHLSNEMFMSLNTIHMAHVPYSGASIALTHTLSGEIDLVSVTVPAAIPFLKTGKMCGLAVLSSARPPRLPNVPISEQASHPNLLLESRYGEMAPKGVRLGIVERLNTELRRIMYQPDTVKQRA